MKRYGFPRQKRLLTPRDYKAVFTSPAKIKSRFCLITFRDNDLAYPRLGLVITKRSFPRAVDRNRIKRILRNSFREYQHQIPNKDIVVKVGNQVLSMKGSELGAVIAEQWLRIK